MLDNTLLDADPPRLDPAPPLRASPAKGQPGDFAFLDGHWHIHHLKRRPDGWDRFDGEARCWSILEGAGSVEELMIPARQFSGLGLRLLDREHGVWQDHWVNARSGVMGAPGVAGGFEDGVGLFPSSYQDQEQTVLTMGIWDLIAPGQCRWRQLFSRDAGARWETDWVMHWHRHG